jgi:small subunit ribosomal protein S5
MGKSYNKKRDLIEKVIRVSRVSQKTKGGDQFGFSVMMVVGDGKGKVGVGVGKARDVVSAIRKGSRRAKKKMRKVPLDGTTIPFQMKAKEGAGKIILKPASQGTGVIAGGPVRSVMEAAGIKDISAKILGSDNQASSVLATLKALDKIQKIITVRGIDLEEKQKESKDNKQEKAKDGKQKKETKQKSAKKKSKKSKQSSKKKVKKSPKKKKKQSKKSKKKDKKDKKKEKDQELEGNPTMSWTRKELNQYAEKAGVKSPKSLPRKQAVIDAIEELDS